MKWAYKSQLDGQPMPSSTRNADKNSGSGPKLLSGGNPQIPKGEGDEPVQVPPKASKHDEVRYFDIYEDDDLDEGQLVSWIEQASNLPGEKM
jgi:hypothetical protein